MKDILHYLERYAEIVITKYTDQRHGTPLFHDGVNSFDGAPVCWKNTDGVEWEISNLASQQNLFRFLASLTAITGKQEYVGAAKDSIAWNFAHADRSGLLTWGGHAFYDLKTLDRVGPADKKMMHELKNHFPFYELMYETDPRATSRLIKAIWNSHISDWDNLDLSRHGLYGKEIDENVFQNHSMNHDLPVLREAKGLSFINIGSDLIFAAAMFSILEKDNRAYEWAEFLAWQYVRTRHPDTKLGAYQYTKPVRRSDPPSDESAHDFTWSTYGDRAERQFSPEFGSIALEANVLFSTIDEQLSRPEKIYGAGSVAVSSLYRDPGSRSGRLLDWTVEGLEAWARYAFVPGTNEYRPMFTDGRDLTGKTYARFGFYGSKGDTFEHGLLSPLVFLSYCAAWSASRRETLWPSICSMAKNFGLGQWTGDPLHEIESSTDADDPLLLLAVLELYDATGADSYLACAQVIGRNLFARTSHRNLFTQSARHIFCRFDDVTPLALACLIAAFEGKKNLMPVFRGTGGVIHGDMMMDDGKVRNIYDVRDIYSRTV